MGRVRKFQRLERGERALVAHAWLEAGGVTLIGEQQAARHVPLRPAGVHPE
jgi:hypothetical protein